uniref:Uncharacterized protein n=1 Tax=Melanopsichium pennsylvanicum 4 TaxID=1398559 RepID=A0A077R8F7_9BASI|nr:uncharacterized protein BN887_06204 [Melanopsichium pennsylvanicum 4]
MLGAVALGLRGMVSIAIGGLQMAVPDGLAGTRDLLNQSSGD